MTMSSLSDKLKSLGVKVGAGDAPSGRPPPEPANLEQVLGGRPYQTPQGETFLVEAFYPHGQPHGQQPLALDAPRHILGAWAGAPDLAGMPPEAFAFLDTETTGLSGGTGTYAFLVGVGRFDGDQFRLAQFFLRDPSEEAAQLYALEEFLAPCQAIVSFNGKTFDLPLLHTRYLTHGWQAPFFDLAHVDLLHLARRLWRERLPSRTLLNLEAHILGALRKAQDVPGWMVPELYFRYLRENDPTHLKGVLYHNAMDVVSLAALLDHMADLLANPVARGGEYGVDLIALARLYEDLGELESATRLYIHGLEHPDAGTQRLPQAVIIKALARLANIYKRQARFEQAIRLWEQAALHNDLDAHVELAKYYEHRDRDFDQAIHWTLTALDVANDSPNLLAYERQQWLGQLKHRLERLKHKADK